jgi:two-component system chemotaxis sensor kinase CheA
VDTDSILRELMATFRAEADEHVRGLNKGLLDIEKGGLERSRLEELFREAHSLKGAARAVDLTDLEQVAHHVEDRLAELRDGKREVTPELMDALYAAVDAVAALVEAPAAKAGIDLAALLERLRDPAAHPGAAPASGLAAGPGQPGPAAPDDRRAPAATRATAPATQPAPAGRTGPAAGMRRSEGSGQPVSGGVARSPGGRSSDPGAQPNPAGSAVPRPRDPGQRGLSSAEDEMIRVQTVKLDSLMGQAGELLVARIRTEQRLADLRGLASRLGRLSATEIEGEVADLLRRFGSDVAHLSRAVTGVQDGLRRVRMLSATTVFEPLERVVRDVSRSAGRQTRLILEGGETEVDKRVLELIRDPLIHLVRNAVDHGVEPPDERERAGKPREGTITVRAEQRGTTLIIEVADDGAGIDREKLRALAEQRGIDLSESEDPISVIFASGFSTARIITDISGRGVGLDVVKERINSLQGTIEVDAEPGAGTTFRLILPITLFTGQALLVRVGGETYALPISAVERIVRVGPDDIVSIEGRDAIRYLDRPVPLVPLAAVLGVPEEDSPEVSTEAEPVLAGARGRAGPVARPRDRAEARGPRKRGAVVLGGPHGRAAFMVDSLLGEREIVVKGLSDPLRRVRNISGATILGSGDVVLILSPSDLVSSARGVSARVSAARRTDEKAAARVLVVDDSITTRTLERNILASAGYEVLVATNGREALDILHRERIDLVVSDIQMPEMDGFSLTREIRSGAWGDLPVILVTSLDSSEDKARGVEAGANAYIVKSNFDQSTLLEVVEQLL